MRYLFVCTGIGAETVAWHPLGCEPAAFAEIDPQASAVLEHHWPDVLNVGDFTSIQRGEYGTIDVLVGGTPCQSFSVAGKRAGLDDPRGNVTMQFARLASRIRPRWIVWENVPGVLSLDGGQAFGAFIGALGQLGYSVAWRILDAQYVRVESHARAVPQRRRRVFLVGYSGDWRAPAGVLFEPEGMRRHPAPRRQAGAQAAGLPERHFARGAGGEIAGTVSAKRAKGSVGPAGDECQNLVVAHTLPSEGADASEDGTGRGLPLVFQPEQITHPANKSNPLPGDPAPTLSGHYAPVVALSCKDHGSDASEDVAPTLRGMSHESGNPNAGGQIAVVVVEGGEANAGADVSPPLTAHAERLSGVPVAIAFDARQCDVVVYGEALGTVDTGVPPVAVAYSLRGRESGAVAEVSGDAAPALRTSGGGADTPRVVAPNLGQTIVRKITELEAERLQGFPDGHTAIEYKGKPLAKGPRYRLIGNAMAVNCMRWIGERIALMDEVLQDLGREHGR